MVNFTIDQVRVIMGQPDNIRNMSVIAHVDHGKSTLTDSLIARAGIIAMRAAGQERYMDTRDDERERGITIKSTGVSLHFEYEKNNYLINLIDSPGHIDFSSEVTAALRVTDGALVVVDTIEGVCVQTETVLRQAMQERIRPVVMVNKADRALIDLLLDAESIYKSFFRVIERVNAVISSFQQTDMGPLEIHPSLGNVAFGSGKDCWGFTLTKFANIYTGRTGLAKEKLMKYLWGDYYYDAKNKKWTTVAQAEDGSPHKRGFVYLIMDPMVKLTAACLADDVPTIEKLLGIINVSLDPAESELKRKPLLKAILRKWIDASEALLEMMVLHLPSPRTAQRYRYSYLYEGPLDDECAIAMKECDAKGPLMMYISKMIPTNDRGRFYAFGRVFSGTLTGGTKVRIMGPQFEAGKKADLREKFIQRCVVMMGRKTEQVEDVPCGNTCAIVGIDDALTKTGTISTHPDAHTIRNMKYSVAPVVRVAVKPKNPADLPKLIAGMLRLSKSDPLVVCENDPETGENIIAGSGELHVQICINDLTKDFCQIELIASEPVVSYRETVLQSSLPALSKSANGHNRLTCSAQPLEDAFVSAVENNEIPMRDIKEKTKMLVDKFGFDKAEVPKIWSFGPNDDGPSILVDATSGCQFMNEIREHMVAGFQLITRQGVLCEEPLRGVRYNIMDTTLHNDAIHRGAGQISPTTRRVLYASQLLAKPTLQEPIFLVEITCPSHVSDQLYYCVTSRRGTVEEETNVEGTPLMLVRAFLPVSESFGFTAFVREQTSGQGFPNCVMDHWDTIDGNYLDSNSQLGKLVTTVRVRKGLKADVENINNFMDKL